MYSLLLLWHISRYGHLTWFEQEKLMFLDLGPYWSSRICAQRCSSFKKERYRYCKYGMLEWLCWMCFKCYANFESPRTCLTFVTILFLMCLTSNLVKVSNLECRKKGKTRQKMNHFVPLVETVQLYYCRSEPRFRFCGVYRRRRSYSLDGICAGGTTKKTRFLFEMNKIFFSVFSL